VAVSVAVGSNVGVAVGSGVDVAVAVAVGFGVNVAVDVSSGVCVAAAPGSGVGVAVDVSSGIAVGAGKLWQAVAANVAVAEIAAILRNLRRDISVDIALSSWCCIPLMVGATAYALCTQWMQIHMARSCHIIQS